jgi:hypothetical protein
VKIIVTESVPESKRAAVRERAGMLLAAALARHPHYAELAAVVSLEPGGRGWNVTVVPIDQALVWDQSLPPGIGRDLIEAVREALRLL